MIERVARARAAARSSTRATGIQTMPINTVFQLMAERGRRRRCGSRARSRSCPDLFGLWLTGELANEVDRRLDHRACSTPRSGSWARRSDRAALGLPRAPFAGESCRARRRARAGARGARRSRGRRGRRAGLDGRRARHRLGVRRRRRCAGRGAAVLSSGTWSLLGLEVPRAAPRRGRGRVQPHQRARSRRHDPAAAQRDGAVARSRSAAARGSAPGAPSDYDGAPRAGRAPRDRMSPLFDPDDEPLAAAPRRHAGADRRRSAAAGSRRRPPARARLVRSILVSLACKYRLVLEQLELVTGTRIEVVHVVGGGVRNELLCQLTADLTRPRGARRARRRRRRSATCWCRRAPSASSSRSLAQIARGRRRASVERRRATSPARRLRHAETYARFLRHRPRSRAARRSAPHRKDDRVTIRPRVRTS